MGEKQNQPVGQDGVSTPPSDQMNDLHSNTDSATDSSEDLNAALTELKKDISEIQ